jgi:MBG domain (YGX type)
VEECFTGIRLIIGPNHQDGITIQADQPPGGGGSDPSGLVCPPPAPPARSKDPNDKLGPVGFGTAGFIAPNAVMPYRIDFENASTATAPAQRVEITDQLNANLDWSTFRFTQAGFGDTMLAVPAGSTYFRTTAAMTYNGKTFNVDVELSFNPATGLVRAVFQSIDSATSLAPDVLTGFLPPEDGTGRGQGYIGYSLKPKAGLATGTEIRNVALIRFDGQPAISTDQVDDHDPSQGTDPTKQAHNTIDAVAPTSSVMPLPAVTTNPTFMVMWDGKDDAGGSGIDVFSVFVSIDRGPFDVWLQGTTEMEASYDGARGHSYAFISIATDNVGLHQSTPTTFQAITMVSPLLATSLSAVSGSGAFGGTGTLTATLTGDGAPLASKPVVFHLLVGGHDTVVGTATTGANGVATLGGVSLAGFHAGTFTQVVTASFALDEDYEASSASGSLAVSKAALLVTADPAVKNYADPDPAFTVSYSGFVLGEGPGALQGALTFTTNEPSNGYAPVGDYRITPSGVSSSDYAIAFGDGKLTIGRAHLTVKADPESRAYGQTNPTLTYQITGFVSGEGLSNSGITGAPALATSAVATSPVGTYPITVGNGTLNAGNYDFSILVNSVLTINKASLTITATNQDMGHGDAVPFLGYGITGFVNNETLSVITGTPALSTTATASSAAGRYAIMIDTSKMSSGNYDFVTVPGTLTVHPKVVDVRVRWGSQSMTILGLTRDLPFSTITGLEVVYSDGVQLPAISALALTAVSGTAPPPQPSSVAMGSSSNDLVWTLPSALGVDMLTEMLFPSQISSLVNGVPIGLYGTNAFNFDVLPGDFTGDRAVLSNDMTAVKNSIGSTNIWADLNGDGKVDLNDVAVPQKKLSSTLPPSR